MRTELKAEVEIQVPFHDVDGMHVVWHGHYYKYFEVARTKLLQSIDYDVHEMKASGYSWPIVETNCKYVRPILYDQLIQVSAKIQEYENRLKIIYRISDAKTDVATPNITTKYTIKTTRILRPFSAKSLVTQNTFRCFSCQQPLV